MDALSTAEPYRAAAPRGQAVADPLAVHPGLWRAHQLGRQSEPVLPSRHAGLDAELPGGGWPLRALTELLLPHPGVGEIRLVAPALAAVQAEQGWVMVFDAPAQVSAWALAGLGLRAQQCLLIQSESPSRAVQTLWALEQALKSGHVGAVLAWLPPRLDAQHLRRLQLAAHQHEGPAFVFRELSAAHNPSPAPLRLALHPAGVDALSIQVLKRRGAVLAQPLTLDLPPVLSSLARRRALPRNLAGGRGLHASLGQPMAAATFVHSA
jgi:protein ImuA